MRYELTLADVAVPQFKAIPPLLLDAVLRELDRLAASPTTASLRAVYPYTDGQLFFGFVTDRFGKRWQVRVHFQYAQDEQALVLTRILLSPT